MLPLLPADSLEIVRLIGHRVALAVSHIAMRNAGVIDKNKEPLRITKDFLKGVLLGIKDRDEWELLTSLAIKNTHDSKNSLLSLKDFELKINIFLDLVCESILYNVGDFLESLEQEPEQKA